MRIKPNEHGNKIKKRSEFQAWIGRIEEGNKYNSETSKSHQVALGNINVMRSKEIKEKFLKHENWFCSSSNKLLLFFNNFLFY